MNLANLLMYASAFALGAYALTRPDKSFQAGLMLGAEQFIIILPRMLCALIAAEFLALLIPTEFISGYLGHEAGIVGILIGSVVGMMVMILVMRMTGGFLVALHQCINYQMKRVRTVR